MTKAPGRIQPMWVILLEALAALLLLIGLVWWTMFSGRKGGERKSTPVETPVDPAASRAEAPGPPTRDAGTDAGTHTRR